MRFFGLRKKLYRLMYDKQGINKKAMQFCCSFDEVRRLLCGREKKEPD